MNRWNVIALYAAIICLISMGCILFSAISWIQDALQLAMPWYLEASMFHDARVDHAVAVHEATMRTAKTLTDKSVYLIIASIFFFFHWRIMKRALQTK